jgi:ribosome biogenesis GTPase
MPIFDLTTIGATDYVYAAFEPYATGGLMLGRVSIVHRDQYRLYTETGEVSAEAIGALLYRSIWPAVGDWVAAQHVRPQEAMIRAVLPRKSVFSRRSAGQREQEQVIAVNVDLALIVAGLDADFNPRRLERYLTLARESGAAAAIALNKSDLCEDPEARLADVVAIAGGAPVVTICARSGHGVERIADLVRLHGVAALLGSSGAGKSTLVNRLLGEDRQPVQEVRESDGRGRHTTTYREFIPLPLGGALIDTPGMRELQLWAGQESLESTFDDIATLATQCRFRDCAHTGELGCAVAAALANGTLDPRRWESYQKLRAEIAWHERKTDVSAAVAEKNRWKKIHKALRSHKDHR